MKKSLIGIVILGGIALLFLGTQNRQTPTEQLVISTDIVDTITAHAHGPTDPDGPDSGWYFTTVFEVPEDTWVTGLEFVTNNAPGHIVHHWRLLDLNNSHPLCSNIMRNEIAVGGTNHVTQKFSLDEPYGMFIPKGTKLAGEVMTHHSDPPYGSGETYHDVSFSFVLDTESTTNTYRNKPVEFRRIFLDDTPCSVPIAHQAFPIPAQTDSYSRISKTDSTPSSEYYIFPTDGTILAMSANTWGGKGGGTIRALLNGDEIAEFTASLIDSSQPWSWIIPISYSSISVHAGDILTLESIYSNPYGKPIPDATGQVGFFFAPDMQ